MTNGWLFSCASSRAICARKPATCCFSCFTSAAEKVGSSVASNCPFLNLISLVNVDGLNDRRIERLKDINPVRGNEFATNTRHNAINFSQAHNSD